MTNQTTEILELAKEFGAVKMIASNGNAPTRYEAVFHDEYELLAFASALRSQDAARVAMFIEEFNESYPNVSQLLNVLEQEWRQQGAWSDWDESTVKQFRRLCGLSYANAQTAAAYVAEVEARALEEAALVAARVKAPEHWEQSLIHAWDMATFEAYRAVLRMAAEKRKQAEQGKEGK